MHLSTLHKYDNNKYDIAIVQKTDIKMWKYEKPPPNSVIYKSPSHVIQIDRNTKKS